MVKRFLDCVQAKPKFGHPLMTPLLKKKSEVLVHDLLRIGTGVDFAGTLIIRNRIRGRPGKESWIAIFVCFSTKAAHIEAVEYLTSRVFIASLRIFCSRRGKPDKIQKQITVDTCNIYNLCLFYQFLHLTKFSKYFHYFQTVCVKLI